MDGKLIWTSRWHGHCIGQAKYKHVITDDNMVIAFWPDKALPLLLYIIVGLSRPRMNKNKLLKEDYLSWYNVQASESNAT